MGLKRKGNSIAKKKEKKEISLSLDILIISTSFLVFRTKRFNVKSCYIFISQIYKVRCPCIYFLSATRLQSDQQERKWFLVWEKRLETRAHSYAKMFNRPWLSFHWEISNPAMEEKEHQILESAFRLIQVLLNWNS